MSSAERITFEVPATLRHLSIFGAGLNAWCERLTPRPGERVTTALDLAIQEAATNVVRHAYKGQDGGRVTLELACDGETISVLLSDGGKPFQVSSVPPPDLEEPHEHGYGVYLIQQLMDSVEYRRAGDRNELRMSKRFSDVEG